MGRIKMVKRSVKKKEFLKIFGNKENYHSIRGSCNLANIGKSSFYRWLKDSEFKRKISEIKEKRNKDPFKPIKRGNISASIKLLKNYGRYSGY